MRKLVTIRKVLEIKPIKEADLIELAIIGNWQCVVNKGDFKVGDLGLYFEIDSFLPINETFEFLKTRCYKKMGEQEGLRLKTIRLKGQLSQGLLLPLTKFPNIDFSDTKKDYSEELNVIKYEPPIPANMQGIIKGQFPTELVPKTDEERIQNLTDEWEQMQRIEDTFYVTEKLHGTSFTCFKWNGEFRVCSRNWELVKEENNIYWKTAIENKLPGIIPDGWAIQGEIIGEGVNKNHYKIKGTKLYVFNVFDIRTQEYIHFHLVQLFCFKNNLTEVPLVSTVKLKNHTINDFIEQSKGDSLVTKGVMREGFVVKQYNNKKSFKVINNDFLIEFE